MFVVGCTTGDELDMIIAMDFANLPPVDLAKLQLFLESLLKSFKLSLNATRVGLVTKKLMPKAGWYLNSGNPGFTILDALKVTEKQTDRQADSIQNATNSPRTTIRLGVNYFEK